MIFPIETLLALGAIVLGVSIAGALLLVFLEALLDKPKPPNDPEMDDEEELIPVVAKKSPKAVAPEPEPHVIYVDEFQRFEPKPTPELEGGIRFEPEPVPAPPAKPFREIQLFPGCKHVPGKRPPRPKRLHMAVDVPADITKELRAQGWTVTTAFEAHLGDESEEANLEYAASRRSILVSRSIDYEIVAHHSAEHNGVLIVPDGMTGELLMDICQRLVRRKGVGS